MKYPIILEPENEKNGGGYSIHFPDLPGCTSEADTLEDALNNARQAASLWLEDAAECAEALPRASNEVTVCSGEIVLWIEFPEPEKKAA